MNPVGLRLWIDVYQEWMGNPTGLLVMRGEFYPNNPGWIQNSYGLYYAKVTVLVDPAHGAPGTGCSSLSANDP